jgi:preprotein translocase subunit YajC
MGNMILAVSKTASKSSSSLSFLLIIVVLFGVFYFVMWRPNNNRRRKMQQQQKEIVPGQRVRTTAGMYATVVAVEDDDVILEVAPGVQSRFVRRAVMEVLGDDVPFTDADGEAGDADAEDGTEAYDETEDEPTGHVEDDSPVHVGDESLNGSAPVGDESRAQDTV